MDMHIILLTYMAGFPPHFPRFTTGLGDPRVRREARASLGTSKGRLLRRQRDCHCWTSAVPPWSRKMLGKWSGKSVVCIYIGISKNVIYMIIYDYIFI